jgi:hypothetical protein
MQQQQQQQRQQQQQQHHRQLQNADIAASLINVGFMDVTFAAFADFTIIDCSPTCTDCSQCGLSDSCGSGIRLQRNQQ